MPEDGATSEKWFEYEKTNDSKLWWNRKKTDEFGIM